MATTRSKALRAKTNASPSADGHAAARLTHPERVLDAESGLTKQQLADYYCAIAPYLLPHITGRPVSLVRCPGGTGQACFFQKHVTSMLPPGIEPVAVPDKKGVVHPYISLATREALAGLAQIAVFELHPWGSRNDDLEHPDRIIFDFDPDASIAWPTLAAAAVEVRAELKQAGLESFVKSTGGKGLHVVAPIEPEHGWAAVKQFTHALVERMERARPDLYVIKAAKAARAGRIFLDYLRNDREATAVAAFSPRARMGVPVAVPLRWEELEAKERPSLRVADFERWKGRLADDPWEAMAGLKQRLRLLPPR